MDSAQTPDLKLLKKLAKACREAGIKEFRGYGIEFILHEVYEPSEPSKKATKGVAFVKENPTDHVETPDELTEDQLLMWSSGGPLEDDKAS